MGKVVRNLGRLFDDRRDCRGNSALGGVVMTAEKPKICMAFHTHVCPRCRKVQYHDIPYIQCIWQPDQLCKECRIKEGEVSHER
jgi:hypothetical protein